MGPDEVVTAWTSWKQTNGRAYGADSEEKYRMQVFYENFQFVQNFKDDMMTAALNGFADLTNAEFKKQFAGYKGQQSAQKNVQTLSTADLPESVDWRSKNAVSDVKNQGQCGSCWAFSTTGGMEGAWQIASGRLTSMSEQQLVDCSTQNAGCNGGSMELAFNYAGTTNVATESSYPYKGRDGSCKSSYTTAIPSGGVTGYKSVGQSSNSLKSALATGPVSVAIEADQTAFQMYSGGVLSSGCGTNLDHGVLAVGYDSTSFKVKNSWGSSWGANGYLQISQSGNTCGIHSDASYPTVSASVAV